MTADWLEEEVGRLYRINVSPGGLPKHAVPSAHLRHAGLDGDRQRHPGVHGGVERAVCLYSLELIEALQREGHAIVPGAIGENLTIQALDWRLVVPGRQLSIGEAVIEVTTFTEPCRQVAGCFRQGRYRRIDQHDYPGWSRVYGRVLKEGRLTIGDAVLLLGEGVEAESVRRP